MKRFIITALFLLVLLVFYLYINPIHPEVESVPTTTPEEISSENLAKPLSSVEEQILVIELPQDSEERDYSLSRLQFDKTFARIDGQRDTLRAETVEESLSNLSDIHFFTWPGVSYEMPMTSKTQRTEKYYAEQIIANRRVQKILQELQQLPESIAEEHLEGQFKIALPRYTEVKKKKDAGNVYDVINGVTGVVFSLEKNSDGSPRVRGARSEVLALVYLSGELGFTGLHDEIQTVVDMAIQDRDYTRLQMDGTPRSGAYGFWFSGASLYNRPVLLKGYMGTLMNSEQQLGLMADQKVHWEEYAITDWDAEVTAFDKPAQYGVPPDFRKGKHSTSLPLYITDEQFDQFLK